MDVHVVTYAEAPGREGSRCLSPLAGAVSMYAVSDSGMRRAVNCERVVFHLTEKQFIELRVSAAFTLLSGNSDSRLCGEIPLSITTAAGNGIFVELKDS